MAAADRPAPVRRGVRRVREEVTSHGEDARGGGPQGAAVALAEEPAAAPQ
ncbi:hypothetical protein GCM10019016_134470 [Streptomyces prasinosporus]|uniref:Uncharacterized protein n=1 Tax=Streptomyces prasinosporus TaxID=68256 RepID=A0ABP6UEY6_9ACTN